MPASISYPFAIRRAVFFLAATTIGSSFFQRVNANRIRGSAEDIVIGKSFFEKTFVLRNVECTLYLSEGTALLPAIEDDSITQTGEKGNNQRIFARDKPEPIQADEHSWVCSDIIADTSKYKKLGQSDIDQITIAELRSSKHFDIQDYIESQNVLPGKFVLKLSKAVLSPGIAELYIPKSSTIRVRPLPEHRRKLEPPLQGALETIYVRVIGQDGTEPVATKKDLFDQIFRYPTGTSMAQQYRSCSGNLLDLKPYKNEDLDGQEVDGVLDLVVASDIIAGTTQRGLITNLATLKLRALGDGSYDRWDLIMFCFPPGTIRTDGATDWLAFALTNNKLSFYNDEGTWCESTSLRMHEVGHNMNLAHSAEKKANDDAVGVMGLSYPEKNSKFGFRRMCYNACKNYQLQWYPVQEKSVNPLNSEAFETLYTLVSVNRYAPLVTNTNLVVLRLEFPSVPLTGPNDFYIGFNEKKGFNDGTMEDFDKVLIYQKEKNGPYDYGTSVKKAVLNFAESYTIANYDNQGKDVQIKFVDLVDGVASVSVVDKSRAPPEEVQDPNKCADDLYPVSIYILPDMYPDDVSWSIVDTETKKTVAFGNQYKTKWAMGQTVDPEFRLACIPYNRIYEFIIKDFYGDGICCFKGAGYYKALDPNDEIMFAGGILAAPGEKKNYGPKAVHAFAAPSAPASPPTGPGGTPGPAPLPTQAPVPSPTQAPAPGPTQAPAPGPTQAPVPGPTQAPAPGPTQAPSSGPQEACTDDVDFRYNEINNYDCKWVAEKKEERCLYTTSDNIKISMKCQKTCLSNCQDEPAPTLTPTPNPKPCEDKNRTFKINKKTYTCNTFEKSGAKCNTKTDNNKGKPNGKTIKEICQKTCGSCRDK